jgi:signal transduction histidine kinase
MPTLESDDSHLLNASHHEKPTSAKEKVNILMVDDQPAKLLSYEVMLRELNENLVKATSAREALGMLLRMDFAVVLLDVNMPEIDGFELAGMIRQHPRFQKTAIFFVSALYVTDLDRLKGYEIGAADYISVPVVPELLRAKVGVFLQLHRKAKEMHDLNAQLQQVSSRLMRVQDEERRRIARELHDSTGQSLAVLTMNLAKISKELKEFRPELAVELSENETIVRAVSDELRTTSYLLHPPLLDEIGLQAGLRWYVEGFKQRSNIEVSLQLIETPQRLPPDLELMLFRVVQECLTNVHRHSGSPTATICLYISQEKLTLEIRDQGKGMTADKLAETAGSGSAGVGLRGMRERVKAFGGDLQISSDGTGTLVRALIPFRAPITEAGSSNS